MEMYDLKKKFESAELSTKGLKPVPEGPRLTITSEQIPGIADYTIGEKCDLHIIGEVKEMRKGNAYADKKKSVVSIVLELVEGGLMSKKPERKEADRLGIDKENYDKLQGKRKNRVEKNKE